MQLDKLQLDLHPRPHWQALDLGHSLFRRYAGVIIKAWLSLWLPLCAITALLIYWLPAGAIYWLFIPWWLRPLLERVMIFIYSRAVFGENVTVRQALRAWPSQLGGGWIRLLTWWRLFMPGRGLYQAIWQLEGARGDVATTRIRVLGRDGCAGAAYWFGIVCVHFEMVLMFGLVGLIGFFLSEAEAMNPLALFFSADARAEQSLIYMQLVGTTLSAALIAPIYVAGTFALYLNRRAELEAWDIEIAFRQMRPQAAANKTTTTSPTTRSPKTHSGHHAIVSALLLVFVAWQSPRTEAADVSNAAAETANCETPEWMQSFEKQDAWNQVDGTPEQQALRARLRAMFDDEALRNYRCHESWRLKKQFESKDKEDEKKNKPFSLAGSVVEVLKIVLLLAIAALLIYLLLHFREPLLRMVGVKVNRKAPVATAIAGLDIRPESLPDDVIAEVHRLWQAQQKRAALALLYRATLSRLAHQSQVEFLQGATEGDCLRQATRAQHNGQLPEERLQILHAVTDLWKSIAYAGVTPKAQIVQQQCESWRAVLEPRT